MPGFVPPPHPPPGSQGNGQPNVSKVAGLFWPQGDPTKLRQAAQAWREMGSALSAAEATCHGAARLVAGSNQGPAIDAFGRYWSKWEGGGGYFELSFQSCGQMAEALDRHADLFHDQKSFNWDELEHALEIGALTGGAGAGVGLGARAAAPFLEDGLPGLSKAANAFGKVPDWMQAGIRGTLVGGGMAAGI